MVLGIVLQSRHAHDGALAVGCGGNPLDIHPAPYYGSFQIDGNFGATVDIDRAGDRIGVRLTGGNGRIMLRPPRGLAMAGKPAGARVEIALVADRPASLVLRSVEPA